MSSRELTSWRAYEEVCGPLGPRRGDYHAAIVAATVINMMKGKKGRRVKPEDLLPPWDGERVREEQTPEEQLRAVKAAHRALGGKGVDRGEPARPRDPRPDQE